MFNYIKHISGCNKLKKYKYTQIKANSQVKYRLIQ
mgnify:CR=1 FL=1